MTRGFFPAAASLSPTASLMQMEEGSPATAVLQELILITAGQWGSIITWKGKLWVLQWAEQQWQAPGTTQPNASDKAKKGRSISTQSRQHQERTCMLFASASTSSGQVSCTTFQSNQQNLSFVAQKKTGEEKS